MNGPVRIVFIGPHRWRAFAIFNGNAFPAGVREIVDACGSRLALLLLHTVAMPSALERDTAGFKEAIQRQREDMESAIRSRPDLTSVAVYDGLAHLAEMHSFLNALKSFLDVYSKLIGKLINPKNDWSFGKAKVGGRELSGGRLINALRNSSKQASLESLADLTLAHSQAWITEAVKYRDQLSHRSDLDNMRRMQLPLHHSAPHVNFDELSKPEMPNGQELERYVEGLLKNLVEYLRESIRMLPNVDCTLISPEKVLGN